MINMVRVFINGYARRRIPPEMLAELKQVHRNLTTNDTYTKGLEMSRFMENREIAKGIAGKLGVDGKYDIFLERKDINAYVYKPYKMEKIALVLSREADMLDKDLKTAIMSHELGHVKHRDVENSNRRHSFAKHMAMFASANAFFSCNIVLGHDMLLKGVTAETAVIEGMIVAASIGTNRVALKAATPVLSMIKRREELRADREAVSAAGLIPVIKLLSVSTTDGRSTLGTLIGAVRRNTRNRPDTLKDTLKVAMGSIKHTVLEFTYASHPSTEKRMRAAIEYAKRHG